MGIYDRDYYWENRDIDGSRLPPSGRRFRVVDEVRYRSSQPSESHSSFRRRSSRPVSQQDHVPEALLKKLTYLALFVALVVAYLLAHRWYALHRIDRIVHSSINALPHAVAAPQAQLQSQSDERRKQLSLERDLEMQRAIARQKLKDRLDREHAERVKRRSAAWERFYQPSPECLRDATVECANAFIRAQKAFNEKYKD